MFPKALKRKLTNSSPRSSTPQGGHRMLMRHWQITLQLGQVSPQVHPALPNERHSGSVTSHLAPQQALVMPLATEGGVSSLPCYPELHGRTACFWCFSSLYAGGRDGSIPPESPVGLLRTPQPPPRILFTSSEQRTIRRYEVRGSDGVLVHPTAPQVIVDAPL